MCAIITPFWAKGRVHKRQEPSGGRVVKNTTRVCCGSKLDLDVLPYINFFQGPGCQASRRGPQTPKAWQLWWLVTFPAKMCVAAEVVINRKQEQPAAKKQCTCRHLVNSPHAHIMLTWQQQSWMNECVFRLLNVKVKLFCFNYNLITLFIYYL